MMEIITGYAFFQLVTTKSFFRTFPYIKQSRICFFYLGENSTMM